jgi:hypothetical protein
MLILLTDKILDQGNSNYTLAQLTNCLENILTARFEGKHLVLANKKEISPVLSNTELSVRSKKALDKIFSEFSQYGGLRHQITCYIRVVEPSRTGIEIISENQQTIVDVPISHFDDTVAIQETLLLAENSKDAELYIHLLKAYLTIQKLRIDIKNSYREGGGSAIKQELNRLCKSKTFCLSIVDTDRQGPDDKLGNTAKRVTSDWPAQKDKKSDWYCSKMTAVVKLIILNVHEIENLIPTNLIRKALPKTTGQPMFDSVDALTKWEADYPNKEWRKFIDIKKGLRGYDVLHWQKGTKSKQCWSEFIAGVSKDSLKFEKGCNPGMNCTKREDCKCLLWEGLGANIHPQVVKYCDEQTPQDIVQFFDFQSDESLKELTEELLAWCCALERLRC